MTAYVFNIRVNYRIDSPSLTMTEYHCKPNQLT